jgi:hypothetical protein
LVLAFLIRVDHLDRQAASRPESRRKDGNMEKFTITIGMLEAERSCRRIHAEDAFYDLRRPTPAIRLQPSFRREAHSKKNRASS